ncbi:MAG: four helix bundle protein [Desulfobacterales bacterium]|nr:four helix bundle protein [Desulfobacterales bacterium]
MDSATDQIKSAKDLRVYKSAYTLSMEIFTLSKHWPAEEKFSLTDQIRRSSRSVCANLREAWAWAKRRYPAHFLSKLTDADGENSETGTWLDFALNCGYIQKMEQEHLSNECIHIGSMIGKMIRNPDPFIVKQK